MLSARPRASRWDHGIGEMATAMAAAGKDVQWIFDDLGHRRGFFKYLSTGVSYGGGQKVCCSYHPKF